MTNDHGTGATAMPSLRAGLSPYLVHSLFAFDVVEQPVQQMHASRRDPVPVPGPVHEDVQHRPGRQDCMTQDSGRLCDGRRLCIWAVLHGKKQFSQKARGHTMCWRWAVGGWRLATVGGGWRRLVVGDWWLMAVGSGWRLVVGRHWRLAAVGGWRLVAVGGWWRLAVGGWQLMVPWGGPSGRSSTKKKSSSLRTPLLCTEMQMAHTPALSCH